MKSADAINFDFVTGGERLARVKLRKRYLSLLFVFPALTSLCRN
jgi:hypothetical protein